MKSNKKLKRVIGNRNSKAKYKFNPLTKFSSRNQIFFGFTNQISNISFSKKNLQKELDAYHIKNKLKKTKKPKPLSFDIPIKITKKKTKPTIQQEITAY